MGYKRAFHVYTDASVCQCTGLSGIGFLIISSDDMQPMQPLVTRRIECGKSSTIAELHAAVAALECLAEHIGEEVCHVILNTDSEAVVCAEKKRSKSNLETRLTALKHRLNVNIYRIDGHMTKDAMTSLDQLAFWFVDHGARNYLRSLRRCVYTV